MRFARVLCALGILVGCGHKSGGDVDAHLGPADACTDNLSCFVVDCGSKGLPATSVSGTVFAPNGTLALYGVNVYVPASDPGALAAGVQCDRCTSDLPGGSIASTITDEAGHFQIDNVPATANVPIVVQVGKWRKQLTLPNVAACQNTQIDAVATTLPKKRSEGDIPQIAITTGNADALECLVRKLGVDDSEFGTSGDTRAVHLYQGNGASSYAVGFAGGSGAFAPAKPFWDAPATLDTYDIVILSCEGDQNIAGTAGINDKPQSSLNALHDYAGKGGRVFMSHWHNVWIGGDRTNPTSSYGLADWKPVINWDFGAAQDEATQLTIVDEVSNPKGMSFATWLLNVGASTTRDQVDVSQPRYTASSIADTTNGQRFIYVDPALSTPLGKQSVQDVLFTTPITDPPDQRCGKVVFSDMHVSSGSTSLSTTPFPGGCATGDLTAQEKALAFIFFDIASCVQVVQ
jgi:hypothetical protein